MKYLVNIKDYLQPKGADIFKIIFIGILKNINGHNGYYLKGRNKVIQKWFVFKNFENYTADDHRKR